MATLKKILSAPAAFKNAAMNLTDSFIPEVTHKIARKTHLPVQVEKVAGYGAAVAVSTAAMMTGFFGGVVAPIGAMTALILGAPVVGAVLALAIPIGVAAAAAGMAMSESTALGDGYFGYADMHKHMFKDEPRVEKKPDAPKNKSWSLKKITALFSRAADKATKAVIKAPAADQSPQIHPVAKPPVPQPT